MQHPVDGSWHDSSLVFNPEEDTWRFLAAAELDAAIETWEGEGSSESTGPDVQQLLKLATVFACLYGFTLLSKTAELQAEAQADTGGDGA